MLTRKVFYNMLAGLIDYGTKVLITLFTTPIIIHGLGTQLFGVWQVLIRLGEQVATVDGRPNEALKWIIAEKQASDDRHLKRRVFAGSLIVWLLFLPLFLLIGGILVWAIPRITNVSAPNHQLVRIALVFTFVGTILATMKSFSAAILTGMNMIYKGMGIMALAQVAGGAFIVYSVHYGLGLSGVAASLIVTGLIGSVASFWIAKRHVDWFGFERPRKEEVLRSLHLSIWFSLWMFIESLLISSDVLLLGYLGSPEEVTVYTVTAYSVQLMTVIIVMTISAAMPGLGGVISNKQYQRAFKLRQESINFIWLLGGAIGSTILICNHSFVRLWVGPNVYAGDYVNLAIVVAILQLVFIRADAAIINLALDIRKKVMYSTISVVAFIVLSIILVPRYKILGLCCSLIIGRMILSFSFPKIVKSFLRAEKEKVIHWPSRIYLVIVLMFFGAWWLGRFNIMDSWPKLVVGAAVGGSLSLLTVYFAGFDSEKRQMLHSRLKSLKVS